MTVTHIPKGALVRANNLFNVNTFTSTTKGSSLNYQKIYNSLMQKRVSEVPTGYTETHHILPKCLGGDNSKENLVKLTAREHFIAHLLLTKCYEVGTVEYYKMVHAFFMMLNAKSDNQERLITSKKYEHLKTAQSTVMSLNQKGVNNSQYGTMWIHCPTLKECKKVNCDTPLPEGWVKGRVVDWNVYMAKKERERLKSLPKPVKPQNQPKQKKPLKQPKVNKHKIKAEYLSSLDWDGLYTAYRDLGYNEFVKVYSLPFTREALLMNFKRRVSVELYSMLKMY